MVEMNDDGNCQFRAISYELFGTQEHYPAVRAAVVKYLRNNGELFSFYVGEENDWQLYLQAMSRDRTWGDELTITAAAKVFNVAIHVVTTEEANWLLRYGADDGEKERFNESQTIADEREVGMVKGGVQRELFLLYISPIHYNVIAPHAPQ